MHIGFTGHQTAQSMYGCGLSEGSTAWVGHGFTDSDMNMGLHGTYDALLVFTCHVVLVCLSS